MTAPTWTRRDALPEGVNYPDTGCPGVAGCDRDLGGNGSLECPHARCVADYPGSRTYAAELRQQRAVVARRLRAERLTRAQVAKVLGVGERTVVRLWRAS